MCWDWLIDLEVDTPVALATTPPTHPAHTPAPRIEDQPEAEALVPIEACAA